MASSDVYLTFDGNNYEQIFRFTHCYVSCSAEGAMKFFLYVPLQGVKQIDKGDRITINPINLVKHANL